MALITIVMYMGVFVFAVTGALKARTHLMDIFGASIISFLAAYGGGTIRDILIGIRPVKWLGDPIALALVLSALFLVYLFKNNMVRFKKLMLIMDAIGLGMFTIAGIELSILSGIGSTYSVILGVITATFGGLVTDLLCNNIPDLLNNGEVYATACFIGGFLYIILSKFGMGDNWKLPICVSIIVLIRIITKLNNIRMPRF